MSQVVTELVIDSNTSGADRFSSAMDKASGSAQQGISSAAGLTLAIAGVGVAFVGALTGLRSFYDYVGKQSQVLADMSDHAELAGISVKEFQQNLFAAMSKGVSEKDFISGFDRIGADLTAASRGVTEFGRLFEANGLSIKNANGELKNTKQAMADLAGLMQNASPQTQQAIAKIVGISASWVPFLKQGVEGIEAQKKAAAGLGIIIDDSTINKAKEFNSAWKVAIATWDLQFKASLAGIMPLLIQLANIASSIINGVGKIYSFFSTALTAPEDMSVTQLTGQLQAMEALRAKMVDLNIEGSEWLKFKYSAAKGALFGDSEADLATADKAIARTKELIARRKELDGLPHITVTGSGTTKLPITEEANDVVDRAINTLKRHTEQQIADTKAMGLGAGAQAQFRAEAALTTAVQANQGKVTEEQKAQFPGLIINARNAADALERVRTVYDLASTATSTIAKDLANGVAPAEALSKALKATAESVIDIASKRIIGNLMADLIGDASSNAAKTAAAVSSATILTGGGNAAGLAMIAGATEAATILGLTVPAAAATLPVAGAATGTEVAAGGVVAGAAIAAGGTAAGLAIWGPLALLAAAMAALGGLALLSGNDNAKKELQAAQDAWKNMRLQVVAFNAAAAGFSLGKLTQELSSLYSTTVQLQQAAQKAKDRAGEVAAANAFNSAVERITTEFVQGTAALTPAAQAIKDLRDEASGLSETLLNIGQTGSASRVNAALQGRIDSLTEQLTSSLTDSLTRDINASKGVSYLNDIADAISALTKNLADAATLSNSSIADLAQQDFAAKTQSIIDSAQLTGDAFTDLTAKFPQLKSVVHEFTASAVQDAQKLRDEQNSAAKNVTDFISNLKGGSASTYSPQETLANALTLYQSNLPLAQAGDAVAQDKWTSLADNLLKAERAVSASGQAYQDRLNQVINQGLALPAVQATTDPVTQAVRDAITAIQVGNAALAAANSLTTGSVLPAVNAGNASAVASALQTYFNQIDPSGKLASILGTQTAYLPGINEYTAANNARLAISNANDNTDIGLAGTNNTLTGTGNSFLTAINTFADRIIQALNSQGSMQAGNFQQMILNSAILLNWMPKLVTTGKESAGGDGGGTNASVPYTAHATGGWIAGGIPGRDSVLLGSRTDIGTPGEFVIRHDIAQMNRSWLPDFNATGRIPVPSFRGGNDNGSTAALIAALIKRIDQLEATLSQATIISGKELTRAIRDTSDDQVEATDENGKRIAFALTQASKDNKAA